MKIISHRGNIKGPIPDKENRPSYIDSAIQLGFDVEIDVRFIDNKFWLGHDTPDYEVSDIWIMKRKEKLWFHCKDLPSALELENLNPTINKFCHNSDPYVIVSNGKMWVHDLTLTLNNKCIIPLLSLNDIESNTTLSFGENIYGICTDYPQNLK